MSRCRHEDIGNLKEEISKLEEIQKMTSQFDNYVGESDEYLSHVKKDADIITECDCLANGSYYFTSLQDKMKTTKEHISNKIASKLSKMYKELQALQDEDDEYHRDEEDDD